MSNQFNGKRLRTARVYRGISIAELAERVDVTRQAISQFEKNESQPKWDTFFRMMKELSFPKEFFFEIETDIIEVGNTYFRSLLSTKKIERESQLERIGLLTRIHHILSEHYLDFPEFNLPRIQRSEQLTDEQIEELALQVRKMWNLGEGPITNMVHVLEKNGFLLTSLSTKTTHIDAFSRGQKFMGKTCYFVVLGNDKSSAVRRQFDTAHEGAHGLLHEWFGVDLSTTEKDEIHKIENEANQFAGPFLLPKRTFYKDLIYPTNLNSYIELKRKWKVSISAMVVRAYQIGRINQGQYRDLMRKMSRLGWRKQEPLDDELPIAQPTLFRSGIQLLLDDGMSGSDILGIFHKHGLSLNAEDIEELLDLEEGMLKTDERKNSMVVRLKKEINSDNSKFKQGV